ncbi:MAG: YghX family hydrolase [Parvularculaceae bacterium]
MKIPQGAFELYDAYCHGGISRRRFMDGLAKFAVGGASVAALAEAMLPDYANAQQIRENDERIIGRRITYPSPDGAGEMGGYLVRPAGAAAPLGGVVVIHENRGLNPHIADVARRAALAGYLTLAPDALYPLGGYPGNDDDGRTMQRRRDRNEMLEDFIAAVGFLQRHEDCTGSVGCVGFCYGGSVSNMLAVRIPDLACAVPFYGGWPDAADAERVNAPLLIHLAGLDERVNAGWPAYKAALDAAGKDYTVHVYEDTNHGFHNDTTARYDAEAAALAWERTLAFFGAHI